jgi:hypothetical protein
MTEVAYIASVAFAVAGGVLLGLAATSERKATPARPVRLPGPGTMESRLYYGHMAEVLDARRQRDREIIP